MVQAPCPREPLQSASADGAHHAEDAIPAQTPCASAKKVAERNSGTVRKTSDFREAHLSPLARNALLRVRRRRCWQVPGCLTEHERLCSRAQRSGPPPSLALQCRPHWLARKPARPREKRRQGDGRAARSGRSL